MYVSSTDCRESRSTKASFCLGSVILSTSQKSNFHCCCLFQSTGKSLPVSSKARRFASYAQCFIRSDLKDKPLFVISWRAIFDSSSHHGSKRFLIESLQPVKAVDFFDKFLLLKPDLPLWLCLTTCAMALLTSVTSCLCALSSSLLQSHFFNFFLYGEILLLLLPSWFCSSAPYIVFCEALSPPWILMLWSARKAAIAPSSSNMFL